MNADLRRGDLTSLRALLFGRTRGPALTALLDARLEAENQFTLLAWAAYYGQADAVRLPWGVDGPPGATGVLSGRGGRKRGPLVRSSNEVMHLMQGCHCALLQKLCKMPKSQTLDP